MLVRSLGIALLLVAAAPALGPVSPVSTTRAASSRTYWIHASPVSPPEHALRDALEAGTQAALAEVARAHAGTYVAGLAHLAAGLALLDDGKPEEALAPLSHPDLGLTRLDDHVLVARARANQAAGRYQAAAEAYAAVLRLGEASPLRCSTAERAAEVLTLVGRTAEAIEALEGVLASCEGRGPRVLQLVAHAQERAGDLAAAAATMDRLLAEHPLSAEAREETTHLKKLAAHRPAVTPAQLLDRDTTRGLALFDAGRYREAATALRSALARGPGRDRQDALRVRLGRALIESGREKDATTVLTAVPPGSPHEAEAAYHLARIRTRRAPSTAPYQSVADRFPGTPFGEEALLDVAHQYQRDGRDAEALPWYRRLADEYGHGRYADAAIWRVAWADFQAGRHRDAADRLEDAARNRPASSYTSGFLYWAARARREMGQDGRANELFEETVRRFKHTYHGQRAVEALGAARAERVAPETVAVEDPGLALTDIQTARVRNLLLVDRLDAALEELAGRSPAPEALGTRAWILARKGQRRAAINTMRRAYPESLGVAGDDLPREAWEILYPLQYGEALQAEAAEAGVDAALVAALIWQESTFDPTAKSSAGALGLMQLMPSTGRALARRAGVKRFKVSLLHDPQHGLDLGTRYLKGMIDAFGGRVERALAAYNAGPGRVEIWRSARGRQSPEEFIEAIPYQETRRYVMNVLANREHYRRLYGLGRDAGATRQTVAGD